MLLVIGRAGAKNWFATCVVELGGLEPLPLQCH